MTSTSSQNLSNCVKSTLTARLPRKAKYIVEYFYPGAREMAEIVHSVFGGQMRIHPVDFTALESTAYFMALNNARGQVISQLTQFHQESGAIRQPAVNLLLRDLQKYIGLLAPVITEQAKTPEKFEDFVFQYGLEFELQSRCFAVERYIFTGELYLVLFCVAFVQFEPSIALRGLSVGGFLLRELCNFDCPPKVKEFSSNFILYCQALLQYELAMQKAQLEIQANEIDGGRFSYREISELFAAAMKYADSALASYKEVSNYSILTRQMTKALKSIAAIGYYCELLQDSSLQKVEISHLQAGVSENLIFLKEIRISRHCIAHYQLQFSFLGTAMQHLNKGKAGTIPKCEREISIPVGEWAPGKVDAVLFVQPKDDPGAQPEELNDFNWLEQERSAEMV